MARRQAESTPSARLSSPSSSSPPVPSRSKAPIGRDRPTQREKLDLAKALLRFRDDLILAMSKAGVMNGNNNPKTARDFWVWFDLRLAGEASGWNATNAAGEMISRVSAHDPDWSGTYRFPTTDTIALGPVHTPNDEVQDLGDDEEVGEDEEAIYDEEDEEDT